MHVHRVLYVSSPPDLFTQANLTAQLEHILSAMLSDVTCVSELLSSLCPPALPHMPPVTCKLLWLHALKERVSGPMTKVRELAPDLLAGDSGWKLRQAYTAVINTIEK